MLGEMPKAINEEAHVSDSEHLENHQTLQKDRRSADFSALLFIHSSVARASNELIYMVKNEPNGLKDWKIRVFPSGR